MKWTGKLDLISGNYGSLGGRGNTLTVLTNDGSSGVSYFSDPQWTNYPNRIYHVRSP
jgi:hypothetical protein